MSNPRLHPRFRRLKVLAYLCHKKSQRHLPPGIRGLAGVILLLAGVIGFLPVLGFWMIPVGLAVLATDIPPLKRWLRNKISSRKKTEGS
ncbi:MAG: hypothetical protein JKY98_12665 [Gammaproteobacteria bacterium]|nr:hypothetical protein [Gammaproteobacteria bacterium]